MNVIIGAGISGLSAGHFLDGDCLILEKADVAGGLSGQYTVDGFAFDHGGHYFHFKNKSAVREHLEFFHPFTFFRRNSKIFMMERFIPYSLQYHLAYLPLRWRQAILEEMAGGRDLRYDNLEEFLQAHFGDSLCTLFFRPFLSKFYRRPLNGLQADMDKGSIPVPRLQEVRRGARGKRRSAEGYNPFFYYPVRGMQQFIDDYARSLMPRIRFGERVLRVDLKKKTVATDRGNYPYDSLISTMPLKELLAILDPPSPFPSDRLQHLSTLVVNAVLSRRRRRFHWLYLPENDVSFYRIGNYPSGKWVSVYLEKTISGSERLGRQEILREMANVLRRTGMIARASEIEFFDLKRIPVSYVVFDREWPRWVPPALAFLRERQVESIGRYGSWNYSSMADDVQSAREAVERIRR
jgi:protoporphyrinogen oxidase